MKVRIENKGEEPILASLYLNI